jgi:hypothetical protein
MVRNSDIDMRSSRKNFVIFNQTLRKEYWKSAWRTRCSNPSLDDTVPRGAPSRLLGAICLLLLDDVVRTAFTVELSLGVLTARVGLPVFAFSVFDVVNRP